MFEYTKEISLSFFYKVIDKKKPKVTVYLYWETKALPIVATAVLLDRASLL